MHIANALAPIFVTIALGAVLRRTGFLTPQFLGTASRLTYWVALPSLLFGKLAATSEIGRGFGTTFVVVLAGMLACLTVSYALAVLLRLPDRQTGVFLQGAFRGNLAYVGLAVVFYGFSSVEGQAVGRQAQTTAILALAPLVPIYNIAAIVVLLAARDRLTWSSLGRVGAKVAVSPLLIGSVAGALYSLLRLPLPPALAGSLDVIGQFALPLALICIGGTLVGAPLRGRLATSVTAGLIKVGVAPAAGLGAAVLLGAGPTETRVALILLACPTAAASFVLADELGGDTPLAAGIIVASTVLSIASLGLVIATM